MEIIDDIFQTAEKAGRFVVTNAVNTKDYVTLEYKIAMISNAINKKYTGLGKLTYIQQTTGDEVEGEKQQIIGEIRTLREKLSALRGEMARFKKICPTCQKTSTAGSEYCSKCGTKL